MAKPWSTGDIAHAKRTKLIVLLLQLFSVSGGVDSSSSDASSSDSSEHVGGAGRAEHITSFALLAHALEPFERRPLRAVIGPQRYSFDWIEREWGKRSLNCSAHFRFATTAKLRRLKRGLRILDVIITRSRHKFTGEEALLIFLRRMACPASLASLVWESGRSTSALSECFNHMTRHVCFTFPHLRDSRSLRTYAAHFGQFAGAVHAKGAPLLNCVGFVDGTLQRCARPGKYQRVLFNGHRRCHSVKWQGITLPNGIMPMPFGPEESCRTS